MTAPTISGLPDVPRRWRLADQIANQLYTARLLDERVRLIQTHHAHLTTRPRLHDIFIEAPQIAASGDRDLLRIAYATAGGPPAVIRLHGPAWSLILSAGRPLPDWLLAIHDAYPLDLLPPSRSKAGWLQAIDLTTDALLVPELTRMCQRIHAAIAPLP